MATYFARKSGNINAADVWAATPSGTAAAVTFASGDVLMANSFTVTVNVSTDLGGTGEVRNDTTGGATASGAFTLADGVTLTANIYARTFTCVNFSSILPAQAFIVGNCFGSTSSGNSAHGANNTSTGNLHITGNCYGSVGTISFPSNGANNASTGNLYITGNCYGGTVGAHGASNAVGGTLTLTGTALGGTGTNFGVFNAGVGSVVVAAAQGGVSGPGVSNASTGSVSVTRAVGNAYGPGNTAGLGAAVGAANVGVGVIEIERIEYGTYGMSATSGTGIRLKKANTNVAVFNYCDTAGAKTLIDATQNAAMPAASNVRSGVSYASGALTGTCAVPAAGSVALGVPVDNTTGTAVLTPAAVWSHATRTITGGLVDTATTLTNAPTVPTTSQIASQVRTELSSELAKVSALNPTRLGQCTTTEILGNLLAQANS